jgi:hypothetical protein
VPIEEEEEEEEEEEWRTVSQEVTSKFCACVKPLLVWEIFNKI